MSENIEFKCKIEWCKYNAPDYKIYATSVNKQEYPNIKTDFKDYVTILGNIHELGIGQIYEVAAAEEMTKYGYSYKIKNIRKDKLRSEEDMYIFLQEILTLGQASELWKYYPDIVERIVSNKTDDIDLSKLHGIGPKRFEKIKEKIIQNYALCDLVIEFGGILSINVLKKLYDEYGSVSQLKYKLRKEPYRCLTNVSGIGFVKADAMLLEMEKQKKVVFDFDLKTSKQRCLACVIYLLEENEKAGHTRMDLRELRKQVVHLVPACAEHYVDCLKTNDIYYDIETYDVALQRTYDIERYIAGTIIEALKYPRKYDIDWKKYQSKGEYPLTDEQLEALHIICENNIMILNGFGGSGKSATSAMIIQMLEENEISYKLFAPTGRAAKVLADYTNKDTSTIHRGLGYMPPATWSYNEECKLKCGVVLVDEFSMVDIFIFRRLIDAIDFRTTKLIMVGDSAQIPSVSAGNLLHDFMKSKIIPTVTLSKIFRYGEGGLMKVATDTRESRKYLPDNNRQKILMFGNNKDYIFIESETANTLKDTCVIYTKLLEQGYQPADIQILSSYNKGDYGTIAINNIIQQIANQKNIKSSEKLTVGETSFYKDDIVIQRANNYKASIYIDDDFMSYEEEQTFIPNGMIGKIVKIEAAFLVIDFDGILVRYSKGDMLDVKLGYAISIHSSQGGSAKVIILLTPSSHTFMLNSNLLYVGLTRMKEKCYHIGSSKTVNISIKKKENFNRRTFMQGLLHSFYATRK